MKKFNLFLVTLVSLFVFNVKVDAGTCTNVAKVGDTPYPTVSDAITAVPDGGTVQLLGCEISEEIKTGQIDKSFTIAGYTNFTTTLTNGIEIGIDNSSMGVYEYTVTIKGIVFKNKGVATFDIRNVNVENNKFENISGSAIRVIDSSTDAVLSNIVIKNNIINGAEMGIRIRNGHSANITGNTIKNTQHNAILFEHGSWSGNNGTVVIDSNTIENWALGGEGRVVRAAFGSATTLEKEISFTNNKMIRSEEPLEEYVKLTSVGTKTVDFEKNYWNTDEPDFDEILSVQGGNETVEVTEYYKAETMSEEDLNTYVLVLDLKELNKVITEVEKLDSSLYTEKSFEALSNYLKEVKEMTFESQNDVDGTVAALNELIASLEKVTKNPSTYDSIYSYIGILIVSCLGLSALLLNKKIIKN